MQDKDRDKGDIKQIQEEWQKGFFDQLKGFSVEAQNNLKSSLAINGDNQLQQQQQQYQENEKPIENEENTLRGTVNEILSKKKNRDKKTLPSKSSKSKRIENDNDCPKKEVTCKKSWTKEEMIKFYKALKTYGINFQMISDYMKTKTSKQVRQKYNRECKQNKNIIDEKLIYYDQNGQKKARKIIGSKMNQLRKLNSQLSTQRSIELLGQASTHQLSKQESTNSAFDFMEKQITDYCNKPIEEKQTNIENQ